MAPPLQPLPSGGCHEKQGRDRKPPDPPDARSGSDRGVRDRVRRRRPPHDQPRGPVLVRPVVHVHRHRTDLRDPRRRLRRRRLPGRPHDQRARSGSRPFTRSSTSRPASSTPRASSCAATPRPFRPRGGPPCSAWRSSASFCSEPGAGSAASSPTSTGSGSSKTRPLPPPARTACGPRHEPPNFRGEGRGPRVVRRERAREALSRGDPLGRELLGVRRGRRGDPGLGADGPDLRLLGHVAARHQHRHDDRDFPDGLPDPARAEQGVQGDPPQTQRNRRRVAGSEQSPHRCRGPERGGDRSAARSLRRTRAPRVEARKGARVPLHRGSARRGARQRHPRQRKPAAAESGRRVASSVRGSRESHPFRCGRESPIRSGA